MGKPLLINALSFVALELVLVCAFRVLPLQSYLLTWFFLFRQSLDASEA